MSDAPKIPCSPEGSPRVCPQCKAKDQDSMDDDGSCMDTTACAERRPAEGPPMSRDEQARRLGYRDAADADAQHAHATAAMCADCERDDIGEIRYCAKHASRPASAPTERPLTFTMRHFRCSYDRGVVLHHDARCEHKDEDRDAEMASNRDVCDLCLRAEPAPDERHGNESESRPVHFTCFAAVERERARVLRVDLAADERRRASAQPCKECGK